MSSKSNLSKLVTLFLNLGLMHYSLAQPEIGRRDPCATQIPPSPGRRYSDNLSCPHFGNESLTNVLLCFSRSELCNGETFCDFGSDEGTGNVTNLQLDCDGSISGRGTAMFVCDNGQNIDINFPLLCDGFPHCFDGSDETNALCENKCLLPYYGGCPHTRECISSHSVSGVHCGECLPGYAENLYNPGGDCFIDPCQQWHNGGCPRTRKCVFTSFTGVRCDSCLPGYVEDPLYPRGECLNLKELLDISTRDPCALQTPPRPEKSFSDNLSCQHAFGASNIQCFNQSQLCDGVEFCGFREDEGFSLELVCSEGIHGPYFMCDAFSRENVSINTLCDGIHDCADGNDETNILCENKCLPPYNGGCPATRWCIVTVFGVRCGECLPGYVKNPEVPSGECILPGCGPLEFPDNGFVQMFSSPLGINITEAIYTCDTGYKLIGENTRICQPNGNWTGSVPTCGEGCGPLSSPANGVAQISLVHDAESGGDTFVAVYTCSTGYRLNGNDNRTCLADQNWSGSEPTCEGCGPLSSPANGVVHIYSSQFGINATYECSEGYNVIGEVVRMCQINNGIWSGRQPVCEIVDCGSLHDPENGMVVYSSTMYNNIATYKCDRDYELFGENTRTCRADGNWTENEPVCKMLVIGFERDSYSVNEAAGNVKICVALNLEAALTFPVERITLRVSTVEITAGEDDYLKIDRKHPNSVIIIENTRRRHCILISITDDIHFECDELFSLHLESSSDTSSNVEFLLFPNVTTVTILANDVFFPYGESDQNISTFTEEDVDDFAPPAIILEKQFIFFGAEETVLFINTNGILSFREAHTTHIPDYFTDDPLISLIAPFWADVDISDGLGEIFYSQTNESTPLNHAVDLINAAGLSLKVNLTNVFVATWNNVAGFNEGAEIRNTFQVALATNGNKSFLFFVYGNIDWIDSDTNIGFKNANGSQFFMLPESPTEAAVEKLNLVQSSNVGVPGLYLYQVDDASNLAPKIWLSTTEKPNHMLEYSVDLRNSFCLENSTEEINFTLHCDATQNLVPHSVQWFYNLDTNNQSLHVSMHNDEYSIVHFGRGNHTLSFGPTTVSETYDAFNVSNQNISLVVTCRLKNDFGGDTKSIKIFQCDLTDCQDGVTNDCTQICHRDTGGMHQCYCKTGYRLQSDEATCEVVDCEPLSPLSNGVVIVSSSVYNSTATFICNRGYELNGESNTTCQHNGNWTVNEPTCKDVDECETDETICDENAYCINTNGSYDCVCFAGYEGNGTTCKDIDECEQLSHNCTLSSQCVNRNGSFACVCLPGFHLFGEGMTCQVIKENQIEIISGATVAGVIFLSILMICGVFCHVQRAKLNKMDTPDQTVDAKEKYNLLYGTRQVEGQAKDLNHFKVHSSSDVVRDIHHELLIYSANLRILETVGQGEFGVVYKGHLMKDLGQTVVGVVAVKTLKGFFDELLVDGLLKECLKMQQFDHPNVVSLAGVCLDGGPTPFLVMPFMENGSLLSYLRHERTNLVIPADYTADNKDEIVSVALKRLLDMCLQIAKGMEYLASMRFVHRDLAARNCMIDMNYVIKVADFGLAEQLETKDYFRQDKRDAIKLPIKWLAPESLADYVFSEKSDVWAYGITCWEIFSGGKAPCASINPTELLSVLENGYRMERPANVACSDEIYSVMLRCWMAEPTERPVFSYLVEKLAYTLESMAGYLHIGAFDHEQQSLTIETV